MDDLASYVTAFLRVFRDPVCTGRRGRPRPVTEPSLLIGQVIKRYARRRVVKVVHRVVRGTAQAIALGTWPTGGQSSPPNLPVLREVLVDRVSC
jgi:hypothetical protein